jgi:hypothetical protein
MVTRVLIGKLLRGAQYLLGVLIILGFLGGWVIAIGTAYDLTQLYSARSWPAREAVITHSYVRHVRGMQRRFYWHAEIAGTYTDGSGKFYVPRHAYGIQNSVNTESQAEAVVKRYPKGATINVYSEPGRPRSAILDPGTSATPNWIALCTGVGLILLPVGLYAWGRLRNKRTRSEQT